MFNFAKVYAEELAALMGEGESVVVAELCQHAFGSDRLDRSPEDWRRVFRLLPGPLREQAVAAMQIDPDEQNPPKGWERVLDKVIDAFSGDLVGKDVDVDQLIGGASAAGHVGSCASRVVAALESARNSSHCVVSDRRLILVEQGNDPDSFTERVWLPLGAVLGARRAGRFGQRGRVVLDFVDLSQVALMTGLLFTGPARRLVAAIGREQR